jgi:hypothetical protein
VMGDIKYAEVEIVRFMNPEDTNQTSKTQEYVDADALTDVINIW